MQENYFLAKQDIQEMRDYATANCQPIKQIALKLSAKTFRVLDLALETHCPLSQVQMFCYSRDSPETSIRG